MSLRARGTKFVFVSTFVFPALPLAIEIEMEVGTCGLCGSQVSSCAAQFSKKIKVADCNDTKK